MDTFSTIPDHIGFTAKNLFSGTQGRLDNGAFARLEPGGGGPAHPHRHAHAHLFIVTRGAATVLMDGTEYRVGAYESLLIPGDALHAVWNKGTETAEMVGLTLSADPPSQQFSGQ